jgi:hypothetical protein
VDKVRIFGLHYFLEASLGIRPVLTDEIIIFFPILQMRKASPESTMYPKVWTPDMEK